MLSPLLLPLISLIALIALSFQLHFPMYIALSLGSIPLMIVAKRSGNSNRQIASALWKGIKRPLKVYQIMLLISICLPLWVASGAMPLVIAKALAFIHPNLYILSVFLITWLTTLLIGSAIGTAGMVGILFVVMSSIGQVSIPLTAGAVLSGIYLGERTSPVSSCANLLSELCEISTIQYIKTNLLHRLPLILGTLGLYALFSSLNPLRGHVASVVTELNQTFHFSLVQLLPFVILILVIALVKEIRLAMILSALTAGLLAFSQNMSLAALMEAALTGFDLQSESLVLQSLKTSGLFGMLGSVLTLLSASLISGLFEHTNLLTPVHLAIQQAKRPIHRKTVVFFSSLLGSCIGCSQTFALLFSHQISKDYYGSTTKEREQLAKDLADTAVLIPAWIPWNVAFSVPIALLGTNYAALLYAFFVTLPPFFELIFQRHEFRGKRLKDVTHLQKKATI